MTDALATHERTDVRTFLGVTGGKQRSHGPPAGLAGVARGLFPNPGPLAPRRRSFVEYTVQRPAMISLWFPSTQSPLAGPTRFLV
jgi:hypothetical protein